MYEEAQRKRLLLELDEFGNENATLYVEALSKEDVKLLRGIYRMLQRLVNSN